MAEVLASLKKIGGNGEQYTETVLWTNPSPTADFAAQTVTLSDSISNYKYIKFVYLVAKSSTTEMDLYVATDKLRTTSSTSGSFALGFNSFGTSSGTNYSWSRPVYYVSDTSIHFNSAQTINVAITQNQRLTPKEILGINELAHGVQDISTMHPDILETFTGSNNTSTKTISVTQKPRFIMYVQGRTTSNTAILLMFDCENETAWQYGMYNGSYYNSAQTFSEYITSISDSSVTLTKFGGTTTMNQIFIYY